MAKHCTQEATDSDAAEILSMPAEDVICIRGKLEDQIDGRCSWVGFGQQACRFLHQGGLVVDDDFTTCPLVKRMVTELGFTCELVSDGAEAVRAVSVSHFDVVLDIYMPVLNGSRDVNVQDLQNQILEFTSKLKEAEDEN